jgi:hypothetical protein
MICRPSITISAGLACAVKMSLRAAEQDQPNVARERQRWRVWQRYLDAKPLYLPGRDRYGYLYDGRYGSCAKGQRPVAKVPWGTGSPPPLWPVCTTTGLSPRWCWMDLWRLDNLPAKRVSGIREANAACGATLM